MANQTITRREFVKSGMAGVVGIAVSGSRALCASSPSAQQQIRIAVIGAGAGGLTAAYTLKQLGYPNATVYEMEAKPGGKVLTDYRLGAPVELGAVIATDQYEVTLQLAREVGAPTVPVTPHEVILDDDGVTVPAHEFAIRKHGLAAVQRAQQRYNALAERYRLKARRGYAGLPEELYIPFAEFAAKHDIMAFADSFRYRVVGYGLSYFENVPAMYFLNMSDINATNTFFIFPRGYQDLWVRVANRLDVHTGSAVTGMRRRMTPKGPRIEMNVNGREEVFDRVILTTPPWATARYLDMTGEERDLFACVVKRNYHVTVANVDGVAADRRANLFPYSSSKPSGAGHIASWYSPAPPRPIFTAYQNVGAAQSDEDARRLLVEDFKKMGGGTVQKILLHKAWDYFAHVETAALKDHFYDRFEALQGKNGTFYATGLLSLEGVENVARYARDLVKEMFAPATRVGPSK